jgi:hypothetical protein
MILGKLTFDKYIKENRVKKNRSVKVYCFNFLLSEDIWYKMDQTFISIVPEPRYGAFGGIYPGYEYFGDVKNNLYLSHGKSQWTMYGNTFTYSFTDLRGLTGIWEHCMHFK